MIDEKTMNIYVIDFGLGLKTDHIRVFNHDICGTLLFQSPELAN